MPRIEKINWDPSLMLPIVAFSSFADPHIDDFNVAPFAAAPFVAPHDVTEVMVILSNHLDAGFNVRAWCAHPNPCNAPNAPHDPSLLECRPWAYYVIQQNFDDFFPRAIAAANALRNTSSGYSYMTQPWIVDFYLDCEASGLNDWRPPHAPLLTCPNASAIAAFKDAVSRGDIWWHAFPHNSCPDTYDASLFSSSLRMGKRLASQLGVRSPTTMSQRDETGMTRAIIPLLAANNISVFSLGSGGSSGGHPRIPDVFNWVDPHTSKEVIVVFDHGYGGGTHILPDGTAVYCAWNTDNGGPLSAASAAAIYQKLQKTYPNANVRAATFDEFADVAVAQRDLLPIVTEEIGDTWLYGVPSDALKGSTFREMSRLRAACIATEEDNKTGPNCDVDHPTMIRFDRLLTKVPEHTWGEDTTWSVEHAR
jgi:hypothetical protein